METKIKTPEILSVQIPAEAPKIQEEIRIVQKVTLPMTPIEAKTLTPAIPVIASRQKAFYVASQWHIEPRDGVDMIEAVNNSTGDRFNGTIAEFNSMLKGN